VVTIRCQGCGKVLQAKSPTTGKPCPGEGVVRVNGPDGVAPRLRCPCGVVTVLLKGGLG
jgi:hypothetical protein